jgi:hypothetical protein
MQIKEIGMKCSILAIFVALSACQLAPSSYKKSYAHYLETESKASVEKLLSSNENARDLKRNAKAILVFANILKVGFGHGVLLNPNERTIGYYHIHAASTEHPLSGDQGLGIALFFMDDESLSYLEKNHGLEPGVGPSVVIIDTNFDKVVSPTTPQKGVYGFIFDRKGALFAREHIKVRKITRVHPRGCGLICL